MADARFAEALDRHKTPALILGLSLRLVLLVIPASGAPIPDWLNMTLWLFHRTLITWCLLVAILGFGRKYLNHAGKALKYCREAAYPVYILHQTVIVVIGFYVVQWNRLAEFGEAAKFALIAVTATVATVLTYDLLIKRTNLTRFLFGMKPLEKRQPVPNLADRLREKSPG
jgi:glucan biosynthesis protein C